MHPASSTIAVRRPVRSRRRFLLLLGLCTVPGLAACSGSGSGDVDENGSETAARQSDAPGTEEAADPVNAPNQLLTSLDEQTIELQFALGEWHGDLEGIISERFRLVRLLTVFEPMHYAIDGRKQGGLTYESARQFETFLNERLGRTRASEKIRIVLVPVRRDELIPFIRDGRGDIAAANLTITEDRLRDVAFSDPFVSDAYEVVVTSPSAIPVESLLSLPIFSARRSRISASIPSYIFRQKTKTETAWNHVRLR